MIRIEGIPIVADRLADAEKAKSAQTRTKRRRTSKIEAIVIALHAIHNKMKAA
jgi:hypothetical protein